MSITLSLDCELMWGISDSISKKYIKNNVETADESLNNIIKLGM